MTHRKEVIDEIPATKKAAKVRNTIIGVLLVLFGILLAVGSFAIVLVLQLFDKYMLVPLVLGVFLAITGAHVWSGELVSASARDAKDLLFSWRKGKT
ncbi:hypothetical protein LCGC14_1382900 [marine sediment metagenome]|uniref:Uncharacterized protein n=1 Tax=marine sediment metagenome TaxID=412755 RepID=A0A0F9N3T5_9ZZZZ